MTGKTVTQTRRRDAERNIVAKLVSLLPGKAAIAYDVPVP